jgi:transcriptional regulator with GAF, ATPase, and Fis domain
VAIEKLLAAWQRDREQREQEQREQRQRAARDRSRRLSALQQSERRKELVALERDHIIAMLRTHRGDVIAVARALRATPAQVRQWCRRFGLDAAAYRE